MSESSGLRSPQQAVIFDLFGTIVPKFDVENFRRSAALSARLVGVEAEAFTRAWRDTWSDTGFAGNYPSTESLIEHICETLGIGIEQPILAEAAAIRIDFTRRCLVPKPKSLDCLLELRRRGYKLGLISNCTAEMPDLWNGSPFERLFDVALFSCTEGLVKPDERIYRRAADRLEIAPANCTYVGDGGSFELSGAESVGMRAVLLSYCGEEPGEAEREALEWKGSRISEISEIVELVGRVG